MAFDEVTLFEFDLEGAQFGPKEMDLPDRMTGKVDTPSRAEGDVEATVETDESSGGPSFGQMVIMAVVVSVVATLLVRRLRGGDEGEETSAQIEFEAEGEVDEEAPELS